MNHRRLLSLLAAPALVACQTAPPAAPPSSLALGTHVSLYGTKSLPCTIHVAASRADLQAGRGTPLFGNPSYSPARAFEIASASEQPESWFVELKPIPAPSTAQQPDGNAAANPGASAPTTTVAPSLWASVPKRSAQACMATDLAPIERAEATLGKAYAYTPWKSECRAIEAFGKALDSMLVDSDPGLVMSVGTVRLLADNADLAALGHHGAALWFSFGDVLTVRADTLEGCFSGVEGGTPPPSPSWEELASVPRGRCAENHEGRHVECSTSLGVWSGLRAPTVLRLTRQDRSLGSVHFWDGAPVDGQRFARTVIAFSTTPPNSDDEQLLARALEQTMGAAVRTEMGSEARLAQPGETTFTHRVNVEVGKLGVGPVQKRNETLVSHYKSGERQVPNPAKPTAIARVEAAYLELDRARAEYDQSVLDFEEAKRVAIEECRRIAAQQEGDAQTWANIGCDAGQIAGRFIRPSRASLDAAEEELSSARADEAATPELLTEDIYSDWSYTSTNYSRSASANLVVTVQRGENPPTTHSVPFSHSWSDYEVQADPAHGVPGHTLDRGYLDSSTKILGPIGAGMSQELARRLRAAVQRATLDAAREAFAKAGGSQSQPGYEDVDAVAYGVARDRLGRAQLRGRAELTSGGVFELPVSAVVRAPDECLLIAAVETLDSASSTSAGLLLETASGRSRDTRRSARAYLEVCPEDVTPTGGADTPPSTHEAVLLRSAADATSVRFGIYTSRPHLDSNDAQPPDAPATPSTDTSPSSASVLPSSAPSDPSKTTKASP